MRAGHRLGAALLATVLAVVPVACSDDDVADPPASTTTTTTASGGATPELLEIVVDGRPSAALVTAGALWVASDGEAVVGEIPDDRPVPGGLRRYDLATGRRLGQTLVGPDPVALVALDESVWTVGATGVLTKVDVSGDEPAKVAEVDLGAALVDGVVFADRLWVADIGAGVVHVLDPETGEVVADPVVVEAGAVRLTVAGERLWVSGLEDQITPIDAEAGIARGPVTVGNAPIGLAAVLDVLWVANSDDDTVTRLSLESGQTIGDLIAVGDAPVAIAVDDVDVWVLNQDGRSVRRLDAETGEPIGSPVDLPMRPRVMTVTDAGVWVVGVDPSLAVLVPRR